MSSIMDSVGSLREHLLARHEGYARTLPVDVCAAEIAGLPTIGGYGSASDSLLARLAAVEADHGTEAKAVTMMLVVLKLVERFYVERRGEAYPEAVRIQFDRHFSMIAAAIRQERLDHFSLAQDTFQKDLAVVREKLVPCGAQLIDVESGIGRRSFLSGGVAEGVRFAAFVYGRLGGPSPLFQLHMDLRLLLDFNPKGWRACFGRVASLLVERPTIKGVFGMSWWFDPALASISPRIAFLREIPQSGGARVFRLGRDAAATNMAITNSKERQEAYRRGDYMPENYALVWGREALVDWASPEAPGA